LIDGGQDALFEFLLGGEELWGKLGDGMKKAA